MSRYKKDLGDFGEKAAAKYLEDKGYKILEYNYSTRVGELDLIAETETHLIFIEVKTRSSLSFGYPSEAIDNKKLLHMKGTAEQYIMKNPTEKDISFDAVEVIASIKYGIPEVIEIRHIPDILI